MAWRIGYSAASVLMCIGCVSLCHMEGGLYICLPSESNGTNLLDEPLKDFIVNPADLPWKSVKRLATSDERVNHDSQWKCTTSAECKTGISAVLMVTSVLGPLQNKWWTLMIMIILMILMLTNDYYFLLYVIHVYMIMRLFRLMVTCCYSNAKRWLTKSYRSKPVSTFEPHEPHVIFAEYDMCSPLLFSPHLRMSTILLEFGRVRLVFNQSVVPVEWSLQPKIKMSFYCLLAMFVFSILLRYVIKHLSFDITLICSHMCDLTS
jgi:hypothetical protein